MLERNLEDLLFSHPYLIDSEFDGLTPRGQRQQARGGDRLDLLYELPSGICLIELKKTHLNLSDLQQLLRYCDTWSQLEDVTLADHHYLIGKRPHDETQLLRAVEESSYSVRLRYLGEDVPLELVWNQSTRRYQPFDGVHVAEDFLYLKL